MDLRFNVDINFFELALFFLGHVYFKHTVFVLGLDFLQN